MPLHVSADLQVPGDKSITHRALMLAATAVGDSRLRGLLPGEDCRSTAAVLRALGCEIPELPEDGGELVVRSRGIGAWTSPAEPLDCGNSGTTARLMMGLLAGRPLRAALTGDDSLRGRPMRRITGPLASMGARFRELGDPDRLPIEVSGGALGPIDYASPTASAQVKSAILLAGLSGSATVSVTEPTLSRDHTERMLSDLGVGVLTMHTPTGWRLLMDSPPAVLPPLELSVPGDPSSAAFLAALALMAGSGELRIRGVCCNPTRIGILAILDRMGGHVALENAVHRGGEPVADWVVRPASLRGTEVRPEEIPAAIDEIPVLAVLAARAAAETRITGARELRVKETDRIAALAANLRAVGAEAEELEDGLVVQGSDRPLRGRIVTHGDHRIAMAFTVLGAIPGNRIEVDDPACAAVSFPGFHATLAALTGGAAAG